MDNYAILTAKNFAVMMSFINSRQHRNNLNMSAKLSPSSLLYIVYMLLHLTYQESHAKTIGRLMMNLSDMLLMPIKQKQPTIMHFHLCENNFMMPTRLKHQKTELCSDFRVLAIVGNYHSIGLFFFSLTGTILQAFRKLLVLIIDTLACLKIYQNPGLVLLVSLFM